MPLSFWIMLACVPFVAWWLAGAYIRHTDAPLEEVRRKIATVIETVRTQGGMMGEHRASIKVEVSMHGVEDKCDMWINWSDHGSECHGIDQRVIEFFQNWSRKAREKYDHERFEDEREAKEKEERERELKELARLKAKYPE